MSIGFGGSVTTTLPFEQCPQMGDWVVVCSDPFFLLPVSSPYEGYIFVAVAQGTAVSEHSGHDIREVTTVRSQA